MVVVGNVVFAGVVVDVVSAGDVSAVVAVVFAGVAVGGGCGVRW